MYLSVISAAAMLGGGNLLMTLLKLLFVVAGLALLYVGFTRIPIPEPIKTILMVIIGLIILAFLYTMFFGGTLGG
jgi:hypothetical protein